MDRLGGLGRPARCAEILSGRRARCHRPGGGPGGGGRFASARRVGDEVFRPGAAAARNNIGASTSAARVICWRPFARQGSSSPAARASTRRRTARGCLNPPLLPPTGRPAGSCSKPRSSCWPPPGGTVARLAGIYGTGRSNLLRKFLGGEAVIEGDGGRWLNQIHRDDAAAALFRLAQSDAPPGVYNVADDHPVTQLDLYTALAASFDRALPPSGPVDLDRKRGWTSKRVANGRLRALGWQPAHPSFLDWAAAQRPPAESPSGH